MVQARKERIWARRIAAFERSGLSRRAWCAGHRLSAKTLDYWRTRLRTRGEDGQAAATALVPIVVAAADPGARCDCVVEIELPNGVRMRAAPGVDAPWLAALLSGIGGC